MPINPHFGTATANFHKKFTDDQSAKIHTQKRIPYMNTKLLLLSILSALAITAGLAHSTVTIIYYDNFTTGTSTQINGQAPAELLQVALSAAHPQE